ncbi:MAG: ABC transporter ATP-binding protein [Limnochordia bacterium]|jgi:ABC-2 type transport system ATP-binding protein
MIQVQGLTKHYGHLEAVKGIDFHVREGEIFGLLGPNGAGKTSCINMLVGLARITRGSARIAGLDVSESVAAVQAHIGVVPDESNLYDELSGFDNLCFCGALYGMRRADREEKAHRLLEQFGLQEAARRPFKTYSKGMKRRLTIAAGIIHQPRLLFLDEPTTGIDVASARQIRRLLIELNASGMTIFLTTHYIEEAERLCHRIALLVDGRITHTGTPQELIASCQAEYLVQITTGTPLAAAPADMAKDFPDLRISLRSDNCVRLHSPTEVDVGPAVAWLHRRSIPVLEAKVIKPSLEEAFVTLTNIDINTLHRDKEGGKR